MSTKASPRVSVVIRCRNEAGNLGPVLDAVFDQENVPAFEVVALDSGSSDGTLELLAARPVRVSHLAPDAFSYGRALNRGAAVALGDIVVYLSAHCRPLTGHWLGDLVAPFCDANVVATFGRQVPIPSLNPIEAITTHRNFPATGPAGVRFSTANGAVRRSAVVSRPFDEEVPIAEDHLWACGLRSTERIVYVPAAGVTHSHPMTAEHWRARFYAHGVAAEYARGRLGVHLPWGDPDDTAARVLFRRAAPFVRLVGQFVRARDLRTLAHLPSYALARTVWYARGLRDGARRYARG
jgi:glycosyltransferase involved in cell wall biosynthesis